jgi:hypothetical protein
MARFQPISRHRVTGGEVSVGVGTLPPWTGRSLVVKQSRREWLRVMRSGGVTSHCIKTSTSRRTPARHPRRLLGVGAARIDDEIYVIDGMIRGAKFGASAVSRPAKSKVAVWQRGWGRRHIATGHLSLARRQHGRANVHPLRSQRDPRAKEPESPSTAVVVEVRIDTLPLPVEGLMVPTGVVDAALIPWPLVPATLIRPHGSRLLLAAPAARVVAHRRAGDGRQRRPARDPVLLRFLPAGLHRTRRLRLGRDARRSAATLISEHDDIAWLTGSDVGWLIS